MFQGTYTALVTPFRNGKVDIDAFRTLIELQIAEGITGIVPVGTTGESPTLDHEEHIEVVRRAIEYAAGRCQVIAGTGSNATSEAVAMTVKAAELGADGALLVAPYYNKPSQQGLYLHYKAIADASPIKLMLYSIPGRSGIEIGVDTTVRLAADCPTIVSIKEAGGSVERVSQLRRALPEAFTILCGDDSLTLPFLSVGAAGVVSVASNLIPREIVHLVGAWNANKPDVARKLHLKLYPLFKELFVEGNPVGVKAAMALCGRIDPELRLPLAPLSASGTASLKAILTDLNLLP